MGPPSSRRSRSSIRSPSSTSSNSHTSCTHSSSSSHPPVELIQKPVQAYFSPHRIPASYPSSPFTASTATVNECCAPRLAQPPRPRSIMGFTKSQRIGILLGIDAVFFLVELVVGYAVHSLALVADSFHMLNDVLSLCVGLWAVRVANTGASKMYTYGWQRAETLGALVNGVFLVALCLSIFLEAIQRFVEPQEVSHPKLVLIVGCFGLASNIVGLFLFHDHGHGHGGHSHGGHSHGHDEISHAEEGHAHSHDSSDDTVVADEGGNIEDVLPQKRIANVGTTAAEQQKKHVTYGTTTDSEGASYKTAPSPSTPGRRARRHSRSHSRGYTSINDMPIHPASFRNEIIAASRMEDIESGESTDNDGDVEAIIEEGGANGQASESSPLLGKKNINGKRSDKPHRHKSLSHGDLHDSHNHNRPRDATGGGGHGHSHGDLNMRGVFLHVMGDALGNIGVIASALIIWLTHFPGRYYFDPGISLVITIIILYSAIPLCKAASRILLQAVPVGLSIDEITDDIESLPRVLSAHHLHVWQLSDTKLVASLHVKVDCEVEGAGSASYMHLAREIRGCLHGYGIHSPTIQPEFTTPQPDSGAAEAGNGHLNAAQAGTSSKAASVNSEGPTCLLECGDKCAGSKMCCPTDGKNGSQNGKK